MSDPRGQYDPIGMAPRGGPAQGVGLAEWEKTYCVFQHLSLLSCFLGIPIIPAVVLWLIKRDLSVFVDDHGKEALNFQISLLIYSLAGGLLLVCLPVAVMLWIAVGVLALIGMINGAVAAKDGRYYRYPATIRLIG